MDYQIQSLPKPQKEWINVAILVGGSGGLAAVYRTNHFKEGQGYEHGRSRVKAPRKGTFGCTSRPRIRAARSGWCVADLD